MLMGFRATAPSFSDPLIGPPNFGWGTTQSSSASFYPLCLSSVGYSLSNTLAQNLYSFNLHRLRLRTRSRMCVGIICRHTLNPFTGHRKGVSPVRERSVEALLRWRILKVAPVSGL
ncbi:hypothetical protein TNIN_16911 [Trichonephila inaurata madagascariensis]|uniref:Uncharacterized protein n=1 Tax=Trichonephila inaurata madagascariensis TaxID=2747483 RepID=A0A8X6Y1Z0_9ARAC|nr:hypothetical protein TNIN_16911 [Trichonephila inaurata madagascariensis]